MELSYKLDLILSTNLGNLGRSCFSLKNGTRAVLYFTSNFSSSLANLNICVEKAGQASCIVITATGASLWGFDISVLLTLIDMILDIFI
jgi:hypothetical protein